MLTVVFYTQDGCSLCDQALDDLEELKSEFQFELSVTDIDSDSALHKKFVELVPVVEIGPYTLTAPFTKTDLEISIRAAMTKEERIPTPVKPRDRTSAIRLNKLVHSFTRHWLAVVNLVVVLYVGLPFTAPALMHVGAVQPASWIYTIYSPMCHQLAFRSWFLFGEQAAYPREIAGTTLTSYAEATGLSEDDLITARKFIGDDQLGYKVALCERDIAIYAGILLGGLLFGLLRTRLKPLPVGLWLLLGILPIAVDGGSQILSVFDFLSFPVRESTPFLRTVTGLLFGLMNVWLAYPYVEQSMLETRAQVAAKLARVDSRSQPVGTS
ncbi:MAG: DUF2085 domain-containing protein [Anaerolineales bacterium]|nr:DUF2085 domain-containing protein [Anaerolineales bacterium]